jgi:hypothetical protein
MSFQGDGCDFLLSFHLVNDQGDHGEVKFSGRRVEMKGQFNPIFEFNVELELIEVDCDGVRFGILRHFFHTPRISLKRQEILSGPQIIKKNVTVRTVTNHIICLK